MKTKLILALTGVVLALAASVAAVAKRRREKCSEK